MSSQGERPDNQPSGLRPAWMLRHADQLARRAGDTTVPRWRTFADYDHVKLISRPEAVAACDRARRAIEALDEVYGAPEWTTFTTLVLLRGSRAAR